ncbi:MAG: dipeptidyl aminopeptidase/acylaminoacyl peptidase [Cyclobacteriaceae bacterium]|jgi:dipeptidyl aminopeptidase/acylaminoacyl peptidase
MIKKLFLSLTLIILVAFFGICYYFSSRIIEPRRRAIEDNAALVAQYGVAENIQVKTSDGLMLDGWYFTQKDSSECAVILAHGYGSNRFGMRHWVPFFWKRGCDVMMYDHRAHGESEGQYGTFGVKESKDLLAVHNFLKSEKGLTDRKIGWVGASWGAATALQAAPQIPDLAFILSDSPFQDLHAAVMERAIRDYGDWVNVLVPTIFWLVEVRADFDPYEASTIPTVGAIETPTLLIHSQTDQATASNQSVAIAAAMKPEILTFHHTDWGSLHVKDVQDYPAKYEELIDDFFLDYQIWENVQIVDSLSN